ncbi:MAG: hypothetical protein ACODAB_07975, partial [Gemmatimonadota bacterium]
MTNAPRRPAAARTTAARPPAVRPAAAFLLAALSAIAQPDRARAQATLSAESIDAIEAVFDDIEAAAPGCAAGVVVD